MDLTGAAGTGIDARRSAAGRRVGQLPRSPGRAPDAVFARRRALLLAGAALTALACAGPAAAQSTDWTGAVSDDWFTAGNWSTDAVPAAFDAVIIDAVTPNPTVINAAGAASDATEIGSADNTTGAATVTGAGTWTTGTLTVGNFGTGTLDILNGGTVTGSAMVTNYIGRNTGSTGTVTVSGTGSSWTVDYLDIATFGTGTLDILNGGAVSTSYIVNMAVVTGSVGAVTVDGTGSSLTGGGGLVVGSSGAGSLTVRNDGAVSGGGSGSFIGNFAGSTGTATVDGIGSSWTDAALYVGVGGDGTLDVLNGATVSSTQGYLGSLAGSTGAVAVDGAGSTWTNANELYVGFEGAATLDILNGGAVSASAGSIGNFAASTGAVAVDGAGSILIVVNSLTVGNNGAGRLTIRNGGTVGDLNGYIGFFAGSTGAATVDGAGSSWTNVESLTVGIFGAGTLDILNGATVSSSYSEIGVAAVGAGAVTVDGAGSTFANSGDVYVGRLGTGSLTVTNGGAVGNFRAYIGAFVNSTGTAMVDGPGSSWTNTDFLNVGMNGAGSLTIRNGGTVNAPLTGVAVNPDSTGTLNIGAVSGAGAAAPGTLNSPTVAFGAGTGLIVFNHTGGGYTFAPQITGAGALRVENGVTNLTAANTYTGTTTVAGGTLLVNGSIAASALTFVSGGTLGGTGTVGATAIGTGGTLSPGNSIGTLTIAGNLAFGSGSTYAVEIEPGGTSDRVAVTGTATIAGGTVAVTALPPFGSYVDGQTYTILTASSVTGAFDNATINSAFLAPSLSYDPGSVYLRLALAQPASVLFPSVAQTFNQRQAASGLAGLAQSGDALAVYNQLLFLPDAAAARRAFDLVSGEIHASARYVVDHGAGLFNRLLRGQAAGGLGASGAASGTMTAPLSYSPLAYSATPRPASLPSGITAADAPGLPVEAYASARVRQAWLAPLGGRGRIEADGNAAALDWWSLGVAGGYEGGLDLARGTGYAGFGLGYLRSGGDVPARLSRLSGDGLHLGAYGGWADGPWTLSGSLSYAATRISTQRRILFGGIDRTAEASYWNHALNVSGEAAYGIDLGAGTTLSPLVTLDAGWSGHGGFTETGAGALNLTAASESWTRLDTGLGFALQHVILTETGKVTLEGRALWEYAFADAVPSQNLSFASSPTGFTVRGPDASRDRLRLGAGVSFEATDRLTVRARYDGVFSGRQHSHGASLGLNVKF